MRFCGDAMASNAGGGSRRLLVDAVEQLFDSGLCVRNPLRPALGTAVREVGGDPGRAERVATDFGRDAGRLGAAAVMHQASDWFMARSDSASALWPRAVRNSQPLRSSAMPAASM
jgi:hypothetical protein